jgi:hypothetical protein
LGSSAPERRPAPEQAPAQTPDAAPVEATPDNASPTGDTEPQITAPIGDEQTQTEPAEGPPIDPPVSWDADAKAKFAAMPRDVQEYVSKREAERNAELRRMQNEAARLRQSFETERQTGTTQLHQLGQHLSTLTGALQSQLLGEFADIKSREDVSRLAVENPARYVQYRDKIDMLNEAQAAQQRISLQQQQERETLRNQAMDHGRKKLAEMAPDLMANEKNQTELFGYLSKSGYSPQELNSIPDPRAFSIAWKAFKYDQAMAKQEAARKAGTTVPTVVKPGSPQSNGGNVEALNAARNQLRKSGHVNDAARVLARIL